MNWLIVALMAPATYATVTFVDKYLLSKKVKDYNAMPIYTAITAMIAGTLFWIANGFPSLPLNDALLVTLVGVLTGFSLIVYFKALSKADTSNITILFQMFPVITLILSYIFLKEVITVQQLIGFGIILLSGVFISLQKSKKKTNISEVFWLILIYDLLWALSGILMKYATNANSFSEVINYESWGIGIGGIIIYLFFNDIRTAFHKSLKKVKLSTLSVIGLNESVFVIAKTLTFYAFSIGPAALVSVLETTQVFFAIIYGYLLTTLFPHIIKEDISKKQIKKRIISALLVVIGIVFISYQ